MGHTVETVTNGDDAFELLQEVDGAFDVVFLDMLMSGGGGAVTLHRIREVWADLPVVVITGKSPLLDSPLFTEGLQLADDRMSKPARLQELDQVVNRMLAR